MSARSFRCPALLGEAGWRHDVLLSVDADGIIEAIRPASQGEAATRLAGPVIPGMVNVHSHAHQRLIAGLTGARGATEDSFWTWRERMYRVTELLDPESLGLLARWLYIELLEGGYTSVGEFHYPHRLNGAAPLASSRALLQAASAAGIGITLLPVWYRYAGFGRQAPNAAQQRFALDLDGYCELLDQLRSATAGEPLQRLGIAPHSLRAVAVEDLPDLLASVPDLPVHLHIAEQTAEVEDCLAHTGLRPVALLARTVDIDQRWCLIHATHADAAERELINTSAAIVGLCPTTEADLGDGLFPAAELIAAGGRVAIGSDSNLRTRAADELALLEWTQRLLSRRRNVLAPAGGHIGAGLWAHTAGHGGLALDQPAGVLAPGYRADFLVLDPSHPLLDGLDPDAQLDTLVTAGGDGLISEVYVAAKRRVQHGRHADREALLPAWRELRRRLVSRVG